MGNYCSQDNARLGPRENGGYTQCAVRMISIDYIILSISPFGLLGYQLLFSNFQLHLETRCYGPWRF